MGEEKPESQGKPASWGLLGVGVAKFINGQALNGC